MDGSRIDVSTGRHPSKASLRKRKASKSSPTRKFELVLYRSGVELVAGVDEVGCGCLAGPVLAAAVILPDSPHLLRRIAGVKDSKVLKREDRERLYDRIMDVAITVGIGLATHAFIDRYGIAPASRVAMSKAVGRLDPIPEHLLVDARRLPLIDCAQTAIIDGDALSLSIAAASIIAKVTRDRLMCCAGLRYAGYGFESHKGYGTPEHHRALIESGPCRIHRMTFRPAFAGCTIAELSGRYRPHADPIEPAEERILDISGPVEGLQPDSISVAFGNEEATADGQRGHYAAVAAPHSAVAAATS